jgi:hypothetical protein
MSELSPLSGEERKSNSEVVRSVDPNSDIETDQSSEAGASPHPRVLCSHFASHEIFRTFNRSREDRNNTNYCRERRRARSEAMVFIPAFLSATA